MHYASGTTFLFGVIFLALIEIRNLCKTFGTGSTAVHALEDVSLDIEAGEIFGIIGLSGAGKSTLVRCMNLLERPTSGTVTVDGADMTALSDKELRAARREIGMIFQNPLDSLNPVYTVGDQVAEAILLDKVDKVEAWNRVVKLFKDVKMPDAEERVKSFPHELSGGMRQRVMIAMMLSRNPELLIADEPTTALDVTIEAQILEIMKELKEKYDTAIMLITHNFGLVAEIADRVGIMYAGEMIETGDVFEIFEHPTHPYTRLLMQALPSKTKAEGRLQTIKGSVPRITEKKPGCRFANRCPYAKDICQTTDPEPVQVGQTHICCCHFAGKDV